MESFLEKIEAHKLQVTPSSLKTFQVNITKLCNQACRHCHVDSSPARREMLSRENIELSLKILEENDEIETLDITGGAPELHPDFRYFVTAARRLNKKVIVRHNLTVTFDPHPVTKESMAYLPDFFLQEKVEVVCSLPYFDGYFTDKQRGNGVFEKSIKSLKLLNDRGFGTEETGLILHLVYNPVGSYLPASQESLEKRYKEVLKRKFNVVFNRLFTITNMPIRRFADDLRRNGQYEAYMDKLWASFNPQALDGVMCRSMISVDHEGKLYDCDFNQMLGLGLDADCESRDLTSFNSSTLLSRKIVLADHCYGCTAGGGSSCGGATT
ncbi:MAG TPA: arsenosugar biosynthesis radical SAM (seleno)protein ArsS [Bacteriovoracaceae bacterium]|nr:arsenosugar biosynthesis radical SAM (seleno)protein ArsS [Bacteriovoracaceae bacterium]